VSNTEALLDAVVARLVARFTTPKADVRKWPEDSKAQPGCVGPQASMWVGYDGSRSGPPEAIDYPIQTRTRRIAVALFTRGLHGVHGAASYLDAVIEVLHGYRPADGGRLTLVEDGFTKTDNGIWRYSLVFASECPAIPIAQDDETDEPGPALRRITLADAAAGDSEIESTTPEEPDPDD
jgi:hypothetical protein